MAMQPYGYPPQQAPAPVPQPPPSGLPVALMQVPASARLKETFGVGFGALGIAGFFIFAGYALDAVLNGLGDLENLAYLGGGLAVGVLASGVELYRRLRPTVLVPFGDRIGIYRRGQLSGTIAWGQLVEFRLRITNTIRELVLYGAVCFWAGLSALAFAADASASSVLWVAWSFAAATFGFGALGSTIWVRMLSKHYFVPKGGGREKVMLLKSKLRTAGVIR